MSQGRRSQEEKTWRKVLSVILRLVPFLCFIAVFIFFYMIFDMNNKIEDKYYNTNDIVNSASNTNTIENNAIENNNVNQTTNTNTSANMSANGSMDGTNKASTSGMYPGYAKYDKLQIKGGGAGGGYYIVCTQDKSGATVLPEGNVDWVVGEE